MTVKRLFDTVWASVALILLTPFAAAVAVWIKLDSPGPVFFRQQRLGYHGVPFRIFKLRTMVADAESRGLQVTEAADARITRCGAFLRHYKLDELPQLINVLKGEMSLVGPRPEVPKYVKFYPPGIRDIVLSVRPGLTDFAAIEFRDEATLLAATEDPETYYISRILPQKLELYRKYVEERSLLVDICLIFKTIIIVFRRN